VFFSTPGETFLRARLYSPEKPNSFARCVNATATQDIGGHVMPAKQPRTSAEASQRRQLVEAIAGVARGDKSAFAQLYAGTSRKLFGVAMNILRDRALAEDALQDAYLKVWRHAAAFDANVASPITWMVTIVRNTAVDEFRKRRIESVDNDDEMLSIASNDPDPADEIDWSRKRALALSALRRLSPDKQKLIMRAFIDETNRNHLAAQYNMPTGTMKTNIHRTVLGLRKSVQDEINDASDRGTRAA
jgi:RNA polymerase sigma-70 factor, ECF subfamily